MYFDKKGAGPAVVLIHGLGAYSYSWRDTVAALSGRYTTYAVDLLGFGQSAAPAGFAYTAKAQAEAVAAFIKDQRLSSPIIIGHSMGGGVCLYLAELAGHGGVPNLSKMVLVAPVTSPPTFPLGGGNMRTLAAATELPGFDAPKVGRDLVTNVLHMAYRNRSLIAPGQIDGYAKGLSTRDQIQAFFKHSSNLDEISFSPSQLSGIKIKTLIIWGTDDRFLEPQRGVNLKGELPNASLEPIDDCGHIPQEERPAKTNDAIVNFLNNTSSS
jgi:pimeloyl-ACP methyl ester carboxylesterase